MKKMLFLSIVGLITACSSSRYAANFQYYKSSTELANEHSKMKPLESVITPIQPEKLVASANNETVLATEKTKLTTVEAVEQVRKTYLQMNKAERKNLRNVLKATLKNNAAFHPAPAANSGRQWWQGWDQDLKLAAIFGAIGTVALIIYVEPFFIIAAVALIIGLVFLIKWFARQ